MTGIKAFPLECRPTISPGAGSFKAGRGTQDGLLSEATPNDLQADRQATVSEAHRDTGCRLTSEVEGVGEEWLQRAGYWLTSAKSRNLIRNGSAGGEASCRGLGCPQNFLFPKMLVDYALATSDGPKTPEG